MAFSARKVRRDRIAVGAVVDSVRQAGGMLFIAFVIRLWALGSQQLEMFR